MTERLAIASAGALLLMLAAAPAVHARTIYVSPTGSATGSCESDSPCTPEHAINDQARGDDEVIIAAGTYTVAAPLVARDRVRVQGAAGQARPALVNDGTGTTTVTITDGDLVYGSIYEQRTLALRDEATAKRLRITQTGERAFGLALDGTTATDIVVVATGNYAKAVLAGDHGDRTPSLRDAIVFAAGGAATAIHTTSASLRLRNVLAIAPNVSGSALDVVGHGYCYQHVGCPGAIPAAVDVRNSILRGAMADAALLSDYPGSHATLNIDHSNFRPGRVAIPGGPSDGHVDDRGGNQSADPRFVDAQAGDYRPAAGSPTIDAGVQDPDSATVDMDGNARPLGAGVDLGPFEFVEPDAQPVQPTAQGTVGGMAPPAVDIPIVPERSAGLTVKTARKRGIVTVHVSVRTGATGAIETTAQRGSTRLRVRRVGRTRNYRFVARRRGSYKVVVRFRGRDGYRTETVTRIVRVRR